MGWFSNTKNPLDEVVHKFTKNDEFTLRDAVKGIAIFGGIGSGKSSGSGKDLAYSFLENGFGGIVLTGKVDETERWIKYAKATGREKDLVIFSPNGQYFFNPLEYLRRDPATGETDNIVALITSIVQMGNRITGSGARGGSEDPFWELAMQRCIKAAVDLLKLAGEEVSFANITRVIREAPTGRNFYYDFLSLFAPEEPDDNSEPENQNKQESDENKKTDREKQIKEWTSLAYTYSCIMKAIDSVKTEKDARAFDVASTYFLTDFPTLPERTRSSVIEQFYAFANPFRSGMLADYFAQGISEDIEPEVTYKEKKIIVLNFPVKEYLQLGIYAQTLYKRLWQQAVERRDIRAFPDPVFLWIDESQYFLTEQDMLFQTTARSARAITVLITQNLSNYYASIGGSNPQARVNSLLGNLVTKILHANNDYFTNEWAAKTIGQTYQYETSTSVGKNQRHIEGKSKSISASTSRKLEFQVPPYEFITLKTGGPQNKNIVEGYITTAGRTWSNDKNYKLLSFTQEKEE